MTLHALLALPRGIKKLFFVVHDALLLFFTYWFSLSLKPAYADEWLNRDNWLLFALSAALTIGLFVKLGLYRAVTRYLGSKVISTALIGSLASALMLVAVNSILGNPFTPAVSVVYFVMLFVLITGSRFVVRAILSGHHPAYHADSVPVLIYGAGNSGRRLLEAVKQEGGYRAVAFIDDNPAIQQATIGDLTVYRPSETARLIEQFHIKKILLALPNLNHEARRAIIRSLGDHPCEVLSLPSIRDWMDGRPSLGALKKISAEDLLGREPVAPDAALMAKDIAGKTVMVTGAGGSIGSELCRQILQNRPKKLVLFELSEYSLYRIEKELREIPFSDGHERPEIVPLLGSVQQRKRLLNAMQTFGVQTIYHAAAYKHVPMVEYNTLEGIRNNVFGTLFSAEAAIEAGVETFVLISTDKAVRPTNTMGASKRLSELVLQALAAEQDNTRFCMVRFGNVLGSSGSVVPVFTKQIAAGGPVTLTHPEITRYFMTIPEAAQLVIQAGAMGQGGDVFVLDMGESVKIIDLARQMIRLSGLTVKDENHPHGDIEIKITGLRPGEKLYEELLIGEAVAGTPHPRILTANETLLPWPQLSELLAELDQACKQGDQAQARALLLKAPTGFNPTDGICDLVWQEAHKAV
ncbi:MAG: nucleoside-diphosphate sugar epimerase/dehydratase [Neisseria sp.]|nr:nucleoside-diphosphate sugar epimerase/dehydratase [Neisseria sp.]